jgi:hypothetical protein
MNRPTFLLVDGREVVCSQRFLGAETVGGGP